MPTTSAVFTPLYAPGLRKVIFESYTYREPECDRFLKQGRSKRQYEDDYQMAGFGGVPEKPEGTGVIYDDPVPDTDMRWVWTARGKGFRATHEAMVDELYGQMRRMADSLGRAFRNQKEVDGAAILNNAFTNPAASTTPNSGYDAKALCATDHALVRTGAAARNEPTVATDLGVTALQDAIIDFDKVLDESGVPIVMIPRLLIVTPENGPIASELLGSTFKPYTADNEINVIQDAGLQRLVSHYITSAKAWFLQAGPEDHDMWMVWREKFMTDAADDFDSGDGKIKGYFRKGEGYGNWRGIWGSPGT